MLYNKSITEKGNENESVYANLASFRMQNEKAVDERDFLEKPRCFFKTK
jgi:hypothetical protein